MGLPDRLLLRPLRPATLIEFKRGNAEPTKIQSHWHRVIRGMGYRVEVCNDRDEFKRLLTT